MDTKELRKELDLSQMQLAVKLRVTTATISRWERGLSRPRKAVLVRINRLIKKVKNNGKGE